MREIFRHVSYSCCIKFRKDLDNIEKKSPIDTILWADLYIEVWNLLFQTGNGYSILDFKKRISELNNK
jgi:hypothetical protein